MTASRKVQTKGNTNKEREQFIITGKAFWAKVRTPSKEAPDKYTMNVSVDDVTAEMLEGKGIKVKTEAESGRDEKRGFYVGTENDRGNYVTLKQSVYKKDGTLMAKPLVIDGKKNPVPESVLIGNGSSVNVQTSVFDWSKNGKKGRSLNLGTIQLKTLVKYQQNRLDDFPDEEYTYEGGTTTANTNDELGYNVDDDVSFD